ncbi:MAG: hypothetical protein GQ564_10995 [Bacteroidales bacterium]|nr:hypothetical protein [Bacteroidales bacterium]
MDKSKNKNFQFFNRIKCLSKWARRWVFIIFAAFMIGFSNAFNDESRWINDIRNFDQMEQVIDNEDLNE